MSDERSTIDSTHGGIPYDGDPSPDELAAIAAWLQDPVSWAEPSAEIEDQVVAAIAAAAAADTAGGYEVGPAPSLSPSGSTAQSAEPSRFRRSRLARRPALAGLAAAAAVAVAVLGGLNHLSRDGREPAFEVALADSGAGAGASATAAVDPLANGVRIVLDIEGLAPAPEGAFYTAWVVREEPRTRIPIGTFHLRRGSGSIELWSGVSVDEYRLITVTLNSEDDPAGTGEPVLAGRLPGG